MTDHKFEPFEKVLVRDYDENKWRAELFSHKLSGGRYQYVTIAGGYMQCIPYTPETAHLLGTSQPYEPPKPPQKYEWGQKVEVLSNRSDWERGIWIKLADNTECPQQHFVALEYGVFIWCKENEIRPLTDTAAHADD